MIPSIWTSMYAEMTLPQALKTLHSQGWTSFELSSEHFEEIRRSQNSTALIEETLECIEQLQLSILQGHGFLDASLADLDADRRNEDIDLLKKHLEIAERLGIEVVVIHPGSTLIYTTRTNFQQIKSYNVEAFRQLGDYAGERGIVIGLENLSMRGAATPDELWSLVDDINHPAIGFTLDTSHANLTQVDIHAAIVELSPRLFATHISDNNELSDQHLVPGSGTIDWIGVMAAFSETNYTGLFCLEIPGERHPLLQLRELKSRYALSVCKWLLTLV